MIGRNKKSVGLDLRKPEGQAIARDLIRGADIVIENFRPGAMEKSGPLLRGAARPTIPSW